MAGTIPSQTLKVLVDALGDMSMANRFVTAVTNRTALSSKDQVILADALTSQLNSKAKAQSAVDELNLAIVSGAALSLSLKKRMIVMMASYTHGNNLINFVQTIATPNIRI